MLYTPVRTELQYKLQNTDVLTMSIYLKLRELMARKGVQPANRRRVKNLTGQAYEKFSLGSLSNFSKSNEMMVNIKSFL